MQLRYLAALKPEDSGGFAVSFPQFPEIATFGDTLVEAVEMAKDALELVVEDMIADGEVLPEPEIGDLTEGWSKILADGAHPHLIEIESPGQAVPVNIAMDKGLLARVDRAAKAKGQSRSGFVAEAVRTALQRSVG